jgi:hypothetical protein
LRINKEKEQEIKDLNSNIEAKAYLQGMQRQ